MDRRTFTLMVAAAALALAPHVARSQGAASYPTKPIRIIVAGPPGIPPDVIARILGERLSASLGQSVFVENRPGTSGIIAFQTLARSAPDGYTLGIISLPAVVTPNLFAQVTYDVEKDFAPVTLINWNYQVRAVRAASFGSVADLIAAAKAKPGALNFASGGNGTPPHLAGELFKRAAGVDIVHIPYKGMLEAFAAVLAGDAHMMIGGTGGISPHVKSGKLRALATSAPQRIAAYPDLPTFAELGYPEVQLRDFQGILAPAGTPKDLIARLHAEIAKATATPDVRRRLEALGMEVASIGPEEFGAHIRSELHRWAKVVRDAGIKPD